MKEIFVSRNNQYSLRNEHPINHLSPQSISFLGGKMWHELSLETKQSLNSKQFKVAVIYVDAVWLRLDIFNIFTRKRA